MLYPLELLRLIKARDKHHLVLEREVSEGGGVEGGETGQGGFERGFSSFKPNPTKHLDFTVPTAIALLNL
jgi:hypothetical protein